MTKGAFLQRYGVLVAFLILFVVSAAWRPDVFLQPENLRNIVNQNVPVGIIALGMTLVIVTGGIDLSVGSMMALTAALGVLALNKMMAGGASESTGAAVAALACGGSGAALGALNGFLVSAGRVAPFVATLVGLVAFRSLCLAIASGGELRSSSSEVFPGLGRGGIPLPFIETQSGSPLIVTWSIILFMLAALIAGFILNKTRFGRYAIAVGANERAAKYSAVNTGAAKFWAYTALGVFVGLAALTSATRMNSVATSSLGLYYELDAIAAVVIGGTSLRGGSARIWGTVVGVLLLGVITNLLVVAGVSVYWQGVVKGAIILAAVLIQRGKSE
ncbi:MAG: ABC transporter permease [Fimbriimonadales bacterium]